MGKMALFLVMGLVVAVGVVTFTINRSKSSLVENVTGFDKYAIARNIAHTGVNMLLRRFDYSKETTDTLNNGGTVNFALSTMGGSCVLTAAAIHPPPATDTIDINCTTTFMDTTKTMKLRLRRQPIPFPTVGEAVGLRVPNVDFKISGSGSGTKGFIDGRNHDINGNLLPADTTSRPGVGVMTKTDSAEVAAYGDNINGTIDVIVDPNMANPADYVDEYINGADKVVPNGSVVSGNETWGTQTNPWIVYCQGDVKITGTVVGWGVLVVHGNLTISGGFTFHGLVLAYKDTKIDVMETGGGGKDANIIGGMIVASPSTDPCTFEMKGSQNTYYSKAALEMAKFIGKLQAYSVMWWYE